VLWCRCTRVDWQLGPWRLNRDSGDGADCRARRIFRGAGWTVHRHGRVRLCILNIQAHCCGRRAVLSGSCHNQQGEDQHAGERLWTACAAAVSWPGTLRYCNICFFITACARFAPTSAGLCMSFRGIVVAVCLWPLALQATCHVFVWGARHCARTLSLCRCRCAGFAERRGAAAVPTRAVCRARVSVDIDDVPALASTSPRGLLVLSGRHSCAL
jgi:hypothetical protein